MSSVVDPPIELETGPNPSAAVIWLHGLGADGRDFEGIVPELGLASLPGVRFVFPHAPYRAVTLNAGYRMRAWYDIGAGASGLQQDATHIAESERIMVDLIQRENARGIPTDAIVLAGFSQGAVVALTTGLHYSQPLAGIMALSAPVIAADRLASEIHPANAATPIFLAHGRRDALVPFSLGERLSRVLGGAGLPLAWHDYPMEHSVCLDEVRDIAIWLRGVLPSR